MIKKLPLLLLLVSICANAQRKFDQYSLEAGYGLGVSGDPGISQFSHFEIGFRYMLDESWGIKFDFGSDKFRTGSNPELGTDYNRYSFQVVHNLGRTIALPDYTNGYINMLAHAGLGYSSLKSINGQDADNIGNIIIGITPQYYLSDSFALTFDASYILNVTQHYNFDGTYPNGKPSGNAFTGTVINASFGITYYFGRNKNGSDWR
ncbi:MAG: hypothetical protein BM557_04340 [Flavobacterium sp. MedPE-SWcel]|uniref:hypothetical protein n=1 Tax=uncultured Flavobacterium sp. TaxID=165435 RepID=UPI000916B2C6|nr:hypothetical protein [uncultured Flavobacterium sp.]OIQ21484.1 MAG: hypothetical protein BM557_04340 [Flavobacterium sp. MedPE-SWcel]